MERSAVFPGRTFGNCPLGICQNRLPGPFMPCRQVPVALSTRHVACRAALSDGGSQGMSAALNPNLVRDPKAPIEFGENPPTRAAVSLKGDRERVGAGEAAQSGAHSSWDEWLRHFDTMDELAEDAAHYQVELNNAVRQERYGDAARHKRKLQEIQAADTVAAVQKELQAALAAEQYGAAAELRDRGLVGLAGWWAGKDGPADFQGHLLHVKPEFGRWTGRIYMARDIAALNGWRENKFTQLLDRGSERSGGGGGRGATGGVLDGVLGLGGGTIGTPMLEVFLRQQPSGGAAVGGAGASSSPLSSPSSSTGDQHQQQPQQQQPLVPGRLVHQAVALRPPPAPGAPGPQQGAGAGASSTSVAAAAAVGGGGAALDPASVVRLSIQVCRDGSARISVLPPKRVRSHFSSWEEEEMRATMAALAAGDLTATPKRAPLSGSNPSSFDSSASADGFQRPSDDEEDDGEDDILTELTRVPAQVTMHGRDRFTFSVLEAGAAGCGSSDSNNSSEVAEGSLRSGGVASASGSSVDLPRWAAVPIDDDDEEGELAAAAQRRASGAGAGASGNAAAASASSAAAAAAAAAAEDAPLLELEVRLPDAAGGRDDGDMAGLSGRRTVLDAVDEAAEAARAAAAARGGRGGSQGSVSEGDEEDDSSVNVSLDLISTGYGRLDAVATSVTDAEEQRILIEIPVARLMRAQQQREAEAEAQQRRESGADVGSSVPVGRGSSSSGGGKDTFDRLAERVAQLQTARAGRRVPPELLASALRSLAHRLLSGGELAADGSSAATASVPSAAAAAAQKATAGLRSHPSPSSSTSKHLPSSTSSSTSSPSSSQLLQQPQPQQQPSGGGACITYSRIPTDLPRSDPFSGLYLGAFGPHGPELIQLSRQVQDGEEVVCAAKVTGDPNVPAGEASFRAKVGRRHRLDWREVYPEHLGIVARYKGEGRVAMPGYKSARWVDGELLQFAVGASPVTGGAELGFVWAVPGEKRFLILLNKLDLKECEK